MSRSDDTRKRSFLIVPLLSRSVYRVWMDDEMNGGEHAGSVRKWLYPSTGLSASAAAGLILAGEGMEGLIKCGLQQSIEPTAAVICNMSLEGGWRGWCMGQKERLR